MLTSTERSQKLSSLRRKICFPNLRRLQGRKFSLQNPAGKESISLWAGGPLLPERASTSRTLTGAPSISRFLRNGWADSARLGLRRNALLLRGFSQHRAAILD